MNKLISILFFSICMSGSSFAQTPGANPCPRGKVLVVDQIQTTTTVSGQVSGSGGIGVVTGGAQVSGTHTKTTTTNIPACKPVQAGGAAPRPRPASTRR